MSDSGDLKKCSYIFEVSQEWIKKKVKLNIQKDYVLSLYFIISVYMFLFTLTFVLIYYGICSYYNTKFPDYSSTENSYFSHIFFTNTLTLSLSFSLSLTAHMHLKITFIHIYGHVKFHSGNVYAMSHYNTAQNFNSRCNDAKTQLALC